MRIGIVQMGDYKEAVVRFANGGPETYHDQRFTVNFVGDLARTAEHVCVISCMAERYDEMLINGVHSVGFKMGESTTEIDVIKRLKLARPTHLIVRVPFAKVLAWGARAGLHVFPLLADSFTSRTLGEWLFAFRMRNALNHRAVQFIGNHNLPASRNLRDLGVDPWKIVPFDYESRWHITPEQSNIKAGPDSDGSVRIIYVGSLIESKGVGDLIDAVPRLSARGLNVQLTVVGKGDVEAFRNRVHELGIQNSVNFAGILPHERIIPLMREHDLVVVPTRHEFGEGMPGTIYEGFCSRTPVLLSDHPVFIKRFRDRQHVMIFRERDPDDLAARIVELISTPALYNLLSVNSLAAWQQLQLPVGWGMLITSVLRGEPSDHKWLRDHSLGSGRYDAM